MKKLVIRILLSPILFIIYSIIWCLLWVFPIPIWIIITTSQLGLYLLYKLFSLGSKNIIYDDEPFINVSRYTIYNHIISITAFIWIIPYTIVNYIKTGELTIFQNE